MIGAPYIFCESVRLHPSRLPDPAFFMDNWERVLRIADLIVVYRQWIEAQNAAELKERFGFVPSHP
jgi:hypothetical protein